jgi:general secretion pathway protein A
MLSNLETDKQKLIQIILVGQPQLRQKLALPELEQLRQRIGVRYHMTPLDSTVLTSPARMEGSNGRRKPPMKCSRSRTASRA